MGDKWQSKTLFLTIFYPRLLIIKSIVDCPLPSVYTYVTICVCPLLITFANDLWFVSLKVLEGNIVRHKILKDVKIPSYHRLYKNVSKLQKIFLIRVFLVKYI